MSTHIVIMAGGVGNRLYPLSTPEHPKQFIDLLGVGKTMIQITYERFKAVDPDAMFWVVTSEKYKHFVHEQLPEVGEDQILCEPEARNTAPCIAYASWKIKQKYPDANMIVTPADAFVPDVEAFAKTARLALDFSADKSAIICLGITPDSPHTGYGYIQAPESNDNVVKVESFKEKPDLDTAKAYLSSGGYYWNAGIFVWNVNTVVSQLREYVPQIASVMDEMALSFYSEKEKECVGKLFGTCEKISIDYALMEKSPDVHMIAGKWFWSDLGHFDAIDAVKKRFF